MSFTTGTTRICESVSGGLIQSWFIASDDLDSDDVAYSSQLRDKNWSWTTRTLMNLGGPDTNYWFNGTAIHRECVVCKLPTVGIKVQRFKSILSWPTNMEMWDKWAEEYCKISLDDEDVDEDAAHQFYLDHKEEMDEGAEVLWPEYEPGN